MLESVAQSLSHNWMALLVGGPGTGKTCCARLLARLTGHRLLEIPLTPGTDTSDLLGSFEQLEPGRRLREAADLASACVTAFQQQLLLSLGGDAGAASEAAPGAQQQQAVHRGTLQAMATAKAHMGQLNEPGVTPTVEDHKRQVVLLQAVADACATACEQACIDEEGKLFLLFPQRLGLKFRTESK